MDGRSGRMEMPGRRATVSTRDGYFGTARMSDYSWEYDEPVERGGNATAPTPVDHLLGSLGACFAVTFRQEAAKHEFDFESLEVTAEAHPESGSVEEIELLVEIGTESSEEEIRRAIDHAERSCNVLELIHEDVPTSVTWSRRTP